MPYAHATGRSLFDCAVLDPRGGGCRVVGVRGVPGAAPRIGVLLEVAAGLTGLWRTDGGGLVATDPSGTVWTSDDPWSERWQAQPLDLALRGAHGRGDAVVVWGERRSDGAPVLAASDGATWAPVPGPGFPVRAARVGAGGIWAIGAGSVACWDGAGWAILEGVGAPVALDASEDVLLAHADGTVSAGDRGGFRLLGRGPAGPAAIARWRGEVWLGGPSGLWRLGHGPVREDRPVTHLDARGELLLTSPGLVWATADGSRFAGALREGGGPAR